jgi:transglutaminase-like putative cysteine protease
METGSSTARVAVMTLLALVLAAPAPVLGSVEERAARHLESAVADGVTVADFHHLVALEMAEELLADTRWIDSALDRLAAAPSSDPLMDAAVRWLRMQVAIRRGRPEAARELFRADGGLEQWWAAGPQPLEELDEFASGPDAPGPGTTWRSVAGTSPDGWVRLNGLGWPAQRQYLYLATTVASTRRQPVAVRLGAAQAVRVWLNGRSLGTLPYPLSRGADQLAVGGWLRSGANQLVVAVGCERDAWWLRARLTAPDGSRLSGVRELNEPLADAVAVDAPQAAPEVRAIRSELEGLVASSGQVAAQAAVALAAVAVTRPWFAATEGLDRELCRAARAEAPAFARILQLRLPDDPATRGELVEAAIAADPEMVRPRLERARWLASRDLRREAAAVLEPVAASAPARAVAVDIAAAGWPGVALPQLEGVASSAESCILVQTVLARRALDSSRLSVARAALARLERVVPGDPGFETLSRELYERCGDADGLERLIGARIAADPNWPRERVRRARLLMAADAAEAARDVLGEGLRRCPLHPELTVELAGVAHRLGDDAAARERLEALLAVRPQEPRAMRLLELLGGAEEDQEWARTSEDLRRLAARPPVSDEDAVGLLEHHELRFLPAQLTEQRVQRAVLIAAAEKANALRRQTIAYVPERQRLRVLSARLLRADGSEVSGRQSDTPRLRDPALNIYYDTRLRVIDFPELEDGDVLELTYILSETAEANETGAYRGGLVPLAWPYPVRTVELELSAEELADLPQWELVNGPRRLERDASDPKRVSMAWQDVAARAMEAPSPPRLLVMPHLIYSNHPDWGELAEWYRRHVALRMVPSAAVEAVARRLTEDVASREAKIAAIYRWVADEISYVSLALGEHRFRPFSADWVVRHTAGDCKDTASLLVAMLSVIDVPARIVLVRTADLGPPASELAALELFNHAIAYLPEDELWLDGTAAGHTWERPPGIDQNATVLVIDGAASQPEALPVVGAGARSRQFQLSAGDEPGTVSVAVRATDSGDAASELRGALAGRNDPTVLAAWLQEVFPGTDVVDVPEIEIRPGQDPARLLVEGTVARSALLAGGGVPVYPGPLELLERYRPSDRRTTPMVVLVEPELEWRLEVELGRQPTMVPDGRSIATRFGELQLDVASSSTSVTVEGRLRLTPGIVEPTAADGMRRFLLDVERALDQPVEVP